MKLYVWNDVLCDYSCGMIVALAPDLETALALEDDSYIRAEMGRVKPEVIDLAADTQPAIWSIRGGG